MRNVRGSFFDFIAQRFTHTKTETLISPPDDWPGRTAVEWVRTLSISDSYTPEIEHLVEVHEAIDAIYGNSGSH